MPKTKFEKKVKRGLVDPNTGNLTTKGVKRENTKKAIGQIAKASLVASGVGLVSKKIADSVGRGGGKSTSASSERAKAPYTAMSREEYKKQPKKVGGAEAYFEYLRLHPNATTHEMMRNVASVSGKNTKNTQTGTKTRSGRR